MSSKDEKNRTQVIDKIAKMDEPRRSIMQRVHDVIVAAAPTLKPRIWYGMPAYAQSASTPALVTLRNDERVNLALTEKVDFQSAGGVDGLLMPEHGISRPWTRTPRSASPRSSVRWSADACCERPPVDGRVPLVQGTCPDRRSRHAPCLTSLIRSGSRRRCRPSVFAVSMTRRGSSSPRRRRSAIVPWNGRYATF